MDGSVPRIRLAFDQGTLLLEGLERDQLQRLTCSGVWTWDPRVSRFRCMAVEYARIRQELRRAFAENFVDEVPIPPEVRYRTVQLPALREDQERAAQAWLSAGGRGVVVMPTGTGKTEVALHLMARTRTAALVVAPVRDLMHQWHHRIRRGLGFDAGILGDARFRLRRVTVTTYDSAYIHMARIGARFGMVIFDEAHHLPGPSLREAALMCAAPLRLGLTATPERADGLHTLLDTLIGPVVYRMGLPEAAGTIVAEYRVVRVPVELNARERTLYDEAGEHVRAFVHARRARGLRTDWKKICADSTTDPEARRARKAFRLRRSIEDRAEGKLRILEDLFRRHAGRPVVVFAGSNAMAMDVSRRFLVPTILSHTRRTERREVLEGFASGRYPVLVANRVLDEGVDIPAAKVAVVIGGQTSTRQAQQRLGRILRKSGDADATLYEVVTEETGDELRSRKRRRSDAYQRTRPGRL